MQLEDSDALKQNKKYAKFQSELHKILSLIERTPLSDWASLNNSLGQIMKVIDSSSYNEVRDIPDRLLVCRVMNKCLDPQGAMGVHRKAVETLSKICAKLGPSGLVMYLPLLSVGVLQLLPTAAMQTRPEIFSLLETHFVTLPYCSLKVAASGLLAAVLPSLEESEGSDNYKRAIRLIESMRRTLQKEEGEDDRTMPHALWSTVRVAPTLRVPALIFLKNHVLRKAKPIANQSDDNLEDEAPLRNSVAAPEGQSALPEGTAEFTCPSLLTEASLANDTSLVRSALLAAMSDRNERCQRIVLDVVCFHFPLHEEGVFTFHDRVALISAALELLVTNPQNATLRRVFMWIYGGNEINSKYYTSVASRYISQSLVNMFAGIASGSVQASPHAFDVLVALQSRPQGEEHFRDVLPEVVSSMCSALVVRGAQTRSALFEIVPWCYFLAHAKDLLVELQQLCGNEYPDLGQQCTEILSRMRSVIEVTRPHYTTSVGDLPAVLELCTMLCGIIERLSTARRRSSAASRSADFCPFIRAALQTFHVLYFGIARGLLSSGSRSLSPFPTGAATGAAAASNTDSPQQPQSPSTASPGQPILAVPPIPISPQTPSAASSSRQETGILFDSIASAYVAIIETYTSSSPADDIFTTSSPSTFLAEETYLFAEVCDTIFSVFSHVAQEVKADQDGMSSMPAESPRGRFPQWLQKTLTVVMECPAGMAICAARLYLDVLLGKLLPAETIKTLEGVDATRRVLRQMWSYLTAHEIEHHVHISKLLHLAATSDLTADMVRELMRAQHPASCRSFVALFRVISELGVSDFAFSDGLMMILGTLTAKDSSLRLMSRAFLEQSVPHFHRIINPILQIMMPPMHPVRPPTSATATFIDTTRTMLDVCGKQIVQRMFFLPVPPFGDVLMDCFQGVVQDDDLAVTNTFSLVAYIILRTVRLELHQSVMTLLNPATASGDDELLRSSSVPSVQQTDESSLLITSIELLIALLRHAVSFSDPPEAVATVCSHISMAAVDFLSTSVAGRLPSAQVLLLDLLECTVGFLDNMQSRKKGRSYSDGNSNANNNDLGQSGAVADITEGSISPPLNPFQSLASSSKNRKKDRTVGSNAEVTTVQALAMGELFRTFHAGIFGASIAELHPTMCCYGLLNCWKSAATFLLPLFHTSLHTATYEFMNTYCSVIRATRERPLNPSTTLVMQRCIQGMTEIVQFLFKPSTKIGESASLTQQQVQKQETMLGVPTLPSLPWFTSSSATSQAGQSSDAVTSYDLAIRELTASLEPVTATIFDTFIRNRRTAMSSSDGKAAPLLDSRQSNAVTRISLETSMRLFLDVLVKDVELEIFDRIIWLWSRRNASILLSAQNPLAVVDGSDDCLVVELLQTTAGITPIMMTNVCDQLLQRFRRGFVKGGGGTARGVVELPYDATVFHFLLTYLTRCKGADRLAQCFSPLLETILGHSTSALLVLPFAYKCVETLHKRHTAAGGSFDITKDKRVSVMLCRMLESFATLTFAEGNASATEEATGGYAALKLFMTTMPEFGAAIFAKDADKITESALPLFKSVVGGIRTAMDLKTHQKVLQASGRVQVCLTAVHSLLLLGDSLARRLRLDVVDILFAQNFFKMSRAAVGKWRQIFGTLSNDRTTHTLILQKLQAPSTPTSMFTAIVQSQDDEASSRGRLLKRLAFYVFSASNIDRDFLNHLRDRIGDTLRQYGKQGKQVPLRYALFIFRVLMVRVPAPQLPMFWPVILPEVIRVLCSPSDEDVSIAIEVLKMIDFSICVLPSEFHVFRWVFFDDQGNIRTLADKKTQFIPLIRAMHSTIPDHIKLSIVRREQPTTDLAPSTLLTTATTAMASPTSASSKKKNSRLHGNEPLLAIPERCYYDLRSLENICAAMSKVSTATSEGLTENEDMFAALASRDDDDDAPTGVIRNGDGFSEPYVMWLLEAEFLHVGVAASEQQMATMGRLQSGAATGSTSAITNTTTSSSTGPKTPRGADGPGSSRPNSPAPLPHRTADLARDETEEFVEVN